jgi:Xaa-Pro aminopeptidase
MSISTLQQRRQRLSQLIEQPILLWSGQASSRNFPANRWPFRASSHFLYWAGSPLENAVVRLEGGRSHLFLDEGSAADALWHGATLPRAELAAQLGIDEHGPLAELTGWGAGAATIWAQDPATQAQQAEILQRPVSPPAKLLDDAYGDRRLAEAITAVRLCHDEAALAQIRQAVQVSVAAHRAGMQATPSAQSEAEVR